MNEERRRRGEVITAVWFVVAIAASGVFTASFAAFPNPQVLGACLGIAFSAIAAALVTMSRDLLPHDEVEDPQHAERSPEDERESAVWLAEGGMKTIGSRKMWLVRLGIFAATALGIAVLFPLRTFGQSPKGRVGLTNWKKGLRLVKDDGTAVHVDDIPHGAVVTAFPEGFVGHDFLKDMGVDAVVVLHVPVDELQLAQDRATWAPQGYIAYSKICTHLECPLGLYRAQSQELMCPCHQSTFNVLDGGHVVFGPAVRNLPMLPLQIASDGTLQAAGYMSNYVGSDNWDYGAKWRRPRERRSG